MGGRLSVEQLIRARHSPSCGVAKDQCGLRHPRCRVRFLTAGDSAVVLMAERRLGHAGRDSAGDRRTSGRSPAAALVGQGGDEVVQLVDGVLSEDGRGALQALDSSSAGNGGRGSVNQESGTDRSCRASGRR
jgi:hypothetical protein